MRLALLGFLAFVSCSGDTARVADEHRVVTVPGGSCGEWDERRGNPTTLVTVKATCGEGLSCVGVAYFDYEPEDVFGRNFRTCLPEDALTCSIPVPPCPAPFTCAVGMGLPWPGACIHTCTTHADCPDSYQICRWENCTVYPCELSTDGSDPCETGTHCQDRICRPD